MAQQGGHSGGLVDRKPCYFIDRRGGGHEARGRNGRKFTGGRRGVCGVYQLQPRRFQVGGVVASRDRILSRPAAVRGAVLAAWKNSTAPGAGLPRSRRTAEFLQPRRRAG